MGLYVLFGLEQDKAIKTKAKAYMVYDINKRKEYVKSLMMTGSGKGYFETNFCPYKNYICFYSR
jgi:phosphopantetheine adenylyltransferase